MSLLVVAKPTSNNQLRVYVEGASFESKVEEAANIAVVSHLTAPAYPTQAGTAGVTADVYLLLKIDRQGKVEDVIAEQINVDATGSRTTMDRWRSVFDDASIAVARKWTFAGATTTTALNENRAFWSVRAPVAYTFSSVGQDYGQWHTFVPGPRQTAPWLQQSPVDPWAVPGTMAAGGLYPAGPTGLHLLTPPALG